MPKKLVLSSIALHAAALAMAIIAAIMYLARDFADTSISDLLDTYQIFLFGLVIGSVLYLADIVMLAKANNRDVISDAQTSALYASVVGDLCMAFCVFPLFINHPALALGIAAECLIVTNFVLRMVCTVELASIAKERSSENKYPMPAVTPPVTLSPKEKKLSLAAAFTGIACVVIGIALFCVVFRIGIPAFYENAAQNSQDLDSTGQLYSGAIGGFVLAFGVIFFVTIQIATLCLVLGVCVALFLFAGGKKRLSLPGIAISLRIMEGFSLVFSLMLLLVLPPNPAVIVTAVLFFSAETAQAILCTVLNAHSKPAFPKN